MAGIDWCAPSHLGHDLIEAVGRKPGKQIPKAFPLSAAGGFGGNERRWLMGLLARKDRFADSQSRHPDSRV